MQRWTGWHTTWSVLFIALVMGTALAATASFPAPAEAQCYVCNAEKHCTACNGEAECGERERGSACTERYDSKGVSCQVTGGCECVKIERTWWFDTERCTPTSESLSFLDRDLRHVKVAGKELVLHRDGERHFAAAACGRPDSWVVLAHEDPNGALRVTTNRLAVRLQRWMYGLSALPQPEVMADAQLFE